MTAFAPQLEFHPLASLFPLIEGEAFEELVADVCEHGLRETIMLYEGKILDGRNRYRACLLAGVDYKAMTRDFRPGVHGDPLAYVLSANLHRRHLTTDQRAAIAAELATMDHGGNRRSDEFKSSNDPLKPALTVVEAATAMKVSPATVKRAKARKAADPEAHEQAKAGTLPKKPRQPRQKPVEPVPVVETLEPGTPEWEAHQDGWEQIAAQARPRQGPVSVVPVEVAAPTLIYPTFEEVRGLYEGTDGAFAKWLTINTKLTVDQLCFDLDHNQLPYARLRNLQQLAKKKGVTFKGPAKPEPVVEIAEPEDFEEYVGDGENDDLGPPKRKAQLSRPKRWADACARAGEALNELKDLQEEYRDWHSNLPENLQGGALAEKLEMIDGLDIDSAIALVDEAEQADLPLGFGRD